MFWLKLEINTVDTQICERVVQRPLDRPHAAAVKQRSSMLGVARIRCGNAHTGRCRFRKRLPTCRDSHQVTLTSVVVTHADAELQIKSKLRLGTCCLSFPDGFLVIIHTGNVPLYGLEIDATVLI